MSNKFNYLWSPRIYFFEFVAHDKNTFFDILSPFSNAVPSNFKLVRIGKLSASITRPLKVIFDTKEVAACLLSSFNIVKRSGTVFFFFDNFRLISTKHFFNVK